ncbi:MAG: ArgE/DapE family deacylase [Spirochaetales bacterium]|nr:ArgE/DapE family deacylase [Spirochaetales bacterium]
MIDQEISRRIDQAVEGLEKELVEFLRRLVRIPTENPPGRNYRECAQLVGLKLQELGCQIRYEEVPEELLPSLAPHGNGLPRMSVLGTYPGPRPRPVLHLTGHYDVVPAGPGWTVEPFGGEIRDGKVWGRGSSDQKSGIAAQVFALQALQSCGVLPAGTLVLSATPDEETGGFAGMGYLVDRGVISLANTDYCIITECMDVDSVCLGHRGTIWLELETIGRQSHGSMPSLGVNAIEKMIKLLGAIERELAPRFAGVSAQPIRPPQCRYSTMAVTTINAGSKVNVVPAVCKATLDWRLVPEQKVSDALEALEELRRQLAEQDPEFESQVRVLMSVDPTLVPSDTPLVEALLEAGRTVLGQPLSFSVSPGSDDQKFVVQKAGLSQCVLYGPGPLEVAHKSDECQPVADLKAGTKILALATLELLGRRDGAAQGSAGV